MARAVPKEDPDAPSQDEVASTELLDELLCSVIAEHPEWDWRISEVLDAIGMPFSLLVSKRLIAIWEAGRIERVGPGTYRFPRRSA